MDGAAGDTSKNESVDAPSSVPATPKPELVNLPKYDPKAYKPARIIGVGVGLLFGLLIIDVIPRVPHQLFVGVILSVIVIVGFRLLKRIFVDAQSRLIEWLAASLVFGLLMSVFVNWLKPSPLELIPIALLSFAWSFGGAAWGWHRAKRINEQRSTRRLWIIATAWLAVPGSIGLAVFAGMIFGLFGIGISWLLGHDTSAVLWQAVQMTLISGLIGLLAWPFLRVAANETRATPKPSTLVETVANQARTTPQSGPMKWESPESKDLNSVKASMLILNATGLGFVLMPLLMRIQIKLRAISIVKKNRNEFPDVVADYFSATALELKDDGFEPLADGQLTGTAANTVLFLSVLVNRERNDTAIALTTYILKPNVALLHNAFVQFGTRFPNTRLMTNNNGVLDLYSEPNPTLHDLFLPLPWIENLHTIYEVHRARVAKFISAHQDNVVQPIAVSENLQEIAASLQSDSDRQIRYLLTLKGLLMGSWSFVWPASLYRKYARRRRAKEELIELGFENLV